MNPVNALSTIPDGLRVPLLDEYNSIVSYYSEHRWSPAELSGGRFCEIVYTILDGYASGSFAASPSKPSNFVGACRVLEQNSQVPRSFQILLPRLLPALYEVRNNRGVGHVGGDVNPNHMDATFVLSSANWIMCELIRVIHSIPVSDAQQVVDRLAELRIPLIWVKGDMRRVLRPDLKQKQQVLLLLASTNGASLADLSSWLEVSNNAYFLKTLRGMHKERLVEFDESTRSIELLPPGLQKAAELIRKQSQN